MAQNTTVSIAANTWVQLTDANISAATFQNNGANAVFIAATSGATPPSDTLGSIRYNPGTGERSTVTLAELFPGISSPNRLYAYAYSAAQVFISHA